MDNPNIKACPICGEQPIFYAMKYNGWRIECRRDDKIKILGQDLGECIERWNEKCAQTFNVGEKE